MKGVLGKISWRSISPSERRPADLRKAILRQSAAYDNLPLEFLELETAREILGEVFNTSASDVDEMIQQRMIEEGSSNEFVEVETHPRDKEPTGTYRRIHIFTFQ